MLPLTLTAAVSLGRQYTQMMLAQLDTVGPADESVSLVAVVAYKFVADAYQLGTGGSELGEHVDLTREVRGGKLTWQARVTAV